MKRQLLCLIILTISLSGRSQEALNYDLFKNFDNERTLKVIKDSIWITKQLWKKTEITNIQEATKVEFVIVPLFDCIDGSQNYNGEKSLIDYLKTNEKQLSAFVTYNSSLIGYISIYYGSIYAKEDNPKLTTPEDVKNYLYGASRKVLREGWIIGSNSEFEMNTLHFNHLKAFYNTIKTLNPRYFFMLVDNRWQIWFIEDNKLKARSIFDENVVEEKELIKGIRKAEVDGKINYVLEYKNCKRP